MVKAKLNELYGDRGWFFDFFVSLVIVVIFPIFKISVDFIEGILNNVNEGTISFFGILVGFLLTAFSLLLTFNPAGSEHLISLKKDPEYKRLLKAFISTSFYFIVLTLLLILMSIFTLGQILLWKYALFFFLTFCILRLLRCVYYLYAIIELS